MSPFISSPETVGNPITHCYCYITVIFLMFSHKDLLILPSSLLCEMSERLHCAHASALSKSPICQANAGSTQFLMCRGTFKGPPEATRLRLPAGSITFIN